MTRDVPRWSRVCITTGALLMMSSAAGIVLAHVVAATNG